MVGVVIRQQQRLAKHCLTLTVGDRSEQVHCRIHHQALHCIEIVSKSRDGAVPGGITGRTFIVWPVPGGKVWRNVIRVAAELEYVPLANAEVLEQLPGRVRTPRGLDTSKFYPPTGKNGIKAGVRILPIQ